MTAKVFIGCAAGGEDAESLSVAEYTLKKYASIPVDIIFMHQGHGVGSFWSDWNTETWATPFSSYRFGCAAYCDFEGRACYADSDVIFRADIAELWRQPIPSGKVVLGKGGSSWRLCVSLWDCSAAKAHLPPISELKRNSRAGAAANSILRAKNLIAPFAGDWNCLDGEGYADLADPRIKAIHYTDMSAQVHLKHALPRLAAAGQKHWYDGKHRKHPRSDLQELFDHLLIEAIDAGFTLDRYIPAEPFGDYKKASLVNYRGAA